MGICQSAALKVVVHGAEKKGKSHYFTMKKMRTFQSLGDVLNAVNVDLAPSDKIYIRTFIGLTEVLTYHKFQIQEVFVKDLHGTFKYRIVMESLY